jgi:hypothetical protein
MLAEVCDFMNVVALWHFRQQPGGGGGIILGVSDRVLRLL